MPVGAGSRTYRGQPQLIDHILVSRTLLTPTNTRLITTGDLPSINDDPTARRNARGSDHALIVADIAS